MELKRIDAMDAARSGLLILICLFYGVGPAMGGTGRQTTTFLVDADEHAVGRWIDDNASAIDQSTGAEILAIRGRQSELRRETKEGEFTFVVQHDPGRNGNYRTILLRSDNVNLVSQETEIQVKREGDGSRVTITVIATVNTHSAMAISIGIRPSLRGMRKLLEGRFGSPNSP
jgi:hypothetical protein